FKDAIVARAVYRGRPHNREWHEIRCGAHRFFSEKLAAAIRRNGCRRCFFIDGLSISTGTDCCKRAYVYEPSHSIAPLDGLSKDRLGPLMIHGEVILRPSGERRARNVVNCVDIIKRFVPVSRIVQATVHQLDLRMLEIAEVACRSDETTNLMSGLDQAVYQMAADEAGRSSYEYFCLFRHCSFFL